MSRTTQPAAAHIRKNFSMRSADIPKIFTRFLLVVFVAGGGYLFSVNLNAIKGYQLRALEKEISTLKEKNTELKIAEADLRSLYRIEANGAGLEMQKLDGATFIEEPGQIAAGNIPQAFQLLTLVSASE